MSNLLTSLGPNTLIAVVKIHIHSSGALVLSKDDYARMGYLGVCREYALEGKKDIQRIERTAMPVREFANLSDWNG